MRPSIRTSTPRRTRLVLAGLAGAGLLASSMSALTPASAASLNLIASTTTLSATASADGATVKLSSTVTFLNLPVGLGITPSGTVTFGDDAGDHLGTAAVSCFLKACTVTHTVSTDKLSDDVSYLKATFVDKLLLKPGTAVVRFGFNRCTGDVEDCSVANVSDNTTDVGVSADSGDTASVTLGGAALPCSLGAGDVVNSTGAGPAGVKELTISYLGTASNTAGGKYSDVSDAIIDSDGAPGGVSGYLCAVAPYAFVGFTPNPGQSFTHTDSDYASFGLAEPITTGAYAGDYVGLLANCFYNAGDFSADPHNGPCIADVYANPDGGGSFTFVVDAPSNDPHFGG